MNFRKITFTIWSLYWLLFIHCILDGVHTRFLLEIGLEEANPIQAQIIASWGSIGMIIFKMIVMIYLGLCLLKLRGENYGLTD